MTTTCNEARGVRSERIGRRSRLRVVKAPTFLFGPLLQPKAKRVNFKKLFQAWGSGLQYVSHMPPSDLIERLNAMRAEHSMGGWWARLWQVYGVNQWLFPTWAQAEQGMVLDEKTRGAGVGFRRLEKGATLKPGERRIRTRGGWLAAWGDWKMMAMMGYAIPDPGHKTSFKTETSLGAFRQSWKFARWVYHRVMEYRGAKKAGRLITVKLYGGEKVICGNEGAYVGLRYTPTESVLQDRMVRIPLTLARKAGVRP